MKRWLALLLALCLALSACGGKVEQQATPTPPPEQPKNIPLDFWVVPTGKWSSEEAVQKWVDEFTALYPEVRVSLTVLDPLLVNDTLEQAAASEGLPDLMLGAPEQFWIKGSTNEALYDLERFWKTNAAEGISPAVEKVCLDDNGIRKLYPFALSPNMMAIRYDAFEKANALEFLDAEQHTWTVDGFRQAVTAVKDSTNEQVGRIYCGMADGEVGIRSLMENMYGGTLLDSTQTAYAAATEQNAKALLTLRDTTGLDFDGEIGGLDETVLFRGGTLPIAFYWNIDNLISVDGRFDTPEFQIMPMHYPTDTGTRAVHADIACLGMFAKQDGERMDAALTMMKFLTEPERYANILRAMQRWPACKMDDIYQDNKVMQLYGSFLGELSPYARTMPGFTQVQAEWLEMLKRVAAGDEPLDSLKIYDRNANNIRLVG